MPYWGRPSGARKGRKLSRREWEEQRQREWEEQQRRFQDLDSDSDTGRGVDLDPAFVSDELYFNGADLGRHRSRRRYSDTPSSSDSEDSEEEQEPGVAHMQVALRDKEDVLVHQAHRRIDKARMLGQTNVKLSRSELEALEKAERKGASKRKSIPSRAMARRSPRNSGPPSPTASRKTSKSSFTRLPRRTSPAPPAHPPGSKVTGPQGEPIYSPLGYYLPNLGPPHGGNSRPLSRPSSSRGLQQRTPPLPPSGFRSEARRNFSGPEQHDYPRPLPDDPDWRPRNRSDSRLTYPVDPFQYQTGGPALSRDPYNSGRRHVSGPADPYSSQRPNIPYPSSSDPSLPQRRYQGEYDDGESHDDDDDDDDSGVLVNVGPHGQEYDVHVGGRDFGSLRPRRSRR